MPKEQEPPLPRVTAIQFDYEQTAIIFEADGKPVAQIPFPTAGSFLFRPASEPTSPATEPVASDESDPQDVPAEVRESQRTITLSGRLKTQPRPGKPDRSGKPTAWARFAAHVEGEREAHYYLATFHRHTTRMALGLPKEAQITVEGYAHPKANPDSKGMDTFSVVRLINYPEKPKKG